MSDPAPHDDRHADDRPEPIADARRLTQVPCLLGDDLVEIAKAEPKIWRRHASTAEHSMFKADWSIPFLVIRTRKEKVKGRALLFVLVAMRPEDEEQRGALFGEFACTPKRFKRAVKRFGMERGLPRRADGFAFAPAPSEMDAMAWSALLDDEDDGDDLPFS